MSFYYFDKMCVCTITCEKAGHDIINFFTSKDMENTPSATVHNVVSHELLSLQVVYFPVKHLYMYLYNKVQFYTLLSWSLFKTH